jgi:hypothetical protein
MPLFFSYPLFVFEVFVSTFANLWVGSTEQSVLQKALQMASVDLYVSSEVCDGVLVLLNLSPFLDI